MARSFADLDWDDITEAAPAVVTAEAMTLNFPIADGIGIGFISCAAIKILAGQARRCSPAVYAIALVFVVRFVAL